MTSAEVPDLRAVAEKTPEEEEFLIYDIEGDLSPDTVLEVFNGFDTPYKFKALSGRRYFIVLRKSMANNAAYAGIRLPGTSRVEVIPAEQVNDFLRYFGVKGTIDRKDVVLPDEHLVFMDFTALNYGQDEEQYKETLRKLGTQYTPVNNQYPSQIFHATCTMPARILCFASMHWAAYDRTLLEGNAVMGGPFQAKYTCTPIVNM